MFKKLTLLAAVLAATSSLAACSSDDTTTAKPTTQTAANGEKFNDADVAFGTDMIPHHAQALLMVDMTIGRELSPEFRALTEGIRDAQGPEIEQMTTWLTEWDQPIPETARDHSNSHDGMGMGMDSDMPGMMSDD
uniref:DUF305 domain-containing protein n=1 Tax=Nocardioides sp. TaxID=35761 RepID=UPI0035618497